jgi:hypothetical protein
MILVAWLEVVFLRKTSMSLRIKWDIYTRSRNPTVGDI